MFSAPLPLRCRESIDGRYSRYDTNVYITYARVVVVIRGLFLPAVYGKWYRVKVGCPMHEPFIWRRHSQFVADARDHTATTAQCIATARHWTECRQWYFHHKKIARFNESVLYDARGIKINRFPFFHALNTNKIIGFLPIILLLCLKLIYYYSKRPLIDYCTSLFGRNRCTTDVI